MLRTAMRATSPHMTRRTRPTTRPERGRLGRGDRPGRTAARLRIDEGGGRPVGHCDTFRCSGRPGRENHPGVVAGPRSFPQPGVRIVRCDHQAGTDHCGYTGLRPYYIGPIGRIVVIDRNVGSADGQYRQNPEIKPRRAGRNAYTDSVPGGHTRRHQSVRQSVDVLGKLSISQAHLVIRQGGGVRESQRRRVQNVDERPR